MRITNKKITWIFIYRVETRPIEAMSMSSSCGNPSTQLLLNKHILSTYIGLPRWEVKNPVAVKNLPANAGDLRTTGSIPGSGRSPGEGHDNPLQYSCLENSMDRGAWQALVHRVA